LPNVHNYAHIETALKTIPPTSRKYLIGQTSFSYDTNIGIRNKKIRLTLIIFKVGPDL
jgi:hypothetical protein